MEIGKINYIESEAGKFHLTNATDLNNLFLAYKNSGKKTLALRFHGGLVDEKEGMWEAGYFLGPFSNADTYPVFFVWESGFIETIKNNLPDILKETIFNLILNHVKTAVTKKLGKLIPTQGASLTFSSYSNFPKTAPFKLQPWMLTQDEIDLTPFQKEDRTFLSDEEMKKEIEKLKVEMKEDIEELEKSLRKDPQFNAEVSLIFASMEPKIRFMMDEDSLKGGTVRASRKTLMSPSVLKQPHPQKQSLSATPEIAIPGWLFRAGKVFVNVIFRFLNGRDHGFLTTIIEEIFREFYIANIGQIIWDEMKKDTGYAFEQDPQIYCGWAFLQGLKNIIKEGNAPQRIVLLGHSAGSIYITNFLQAAAKVIPEFSFEIVLFAPACTFDLFNKTVMAYGKQISQIRVFGMEDGLEQKNVLVPVIYEKSLLYFISGCLEAHSDEPILGMQRFYSGKKPFDKGPIPEVIQYLNQPSHPGPFVWSIADDGPGRSSHSIDHGGFDEDLYTLGSTDYILKNGFK